MPFRRNSFLAAASAAALTSCLVLGAGAPSPARAQKAAARPAGGAPGNFGRANLANAAAFTITDVLTPKQGSKVVQTMKVEVKGNRGRLDFENPAIGAVRYVANEKGVFFYIPANKTATRQQVKGGVDTAIRTAFAQFGGYLRGAKKVGTGTVSGLPAAIYKDPESGALVYVSTKPGFKLPVKLVLDNEGGKRTVTISAVRLNPSLADARFVLPAGTQVIEGGGAPVPGAGVPGAGR